MAGREDWVELMTLGREQPLGVGPSDHTLSSDPPRLACIGSAYWNPLALKANIFVLVMAEDNWGQHYVWFLPHSKTCSYPSTSEFRNAFLKTIRQIIRESVRNMSLPPLGQELVSKQS